MSKQLLKQTGIGPIGGDCTGEIYFDKEFQLENENVPRTFSNKSGGNLAGVESNIDYLASLGYKIQPANPIAGGDNKSSHHYWNKNNFQISDDVGNMENFNSYARKLFQKGMVYVYDGTYTSEGLEGIHFQYAMRWADRKPQSYYWFKMQSLENQSLGMGVVPKHKENLRHRVVNAPVFYNENTKKIEQNPNYNPNKETDSGLEKFVSYLNLPIWDIAIISILYSIVEVYFIYVYSYLIAKSIVPKTVV